jgi:hypothetical protein
MKLLAILGIIFSLSVQAQEIPKKDKVDIKDALLNMCKKSDYIFIGETGTTFDEKAILALLPELKEGGLSALVINDPMYSEYKNEIKKSGIKVIVMDFTRENSVISDELISKRPDKDAKVLVLGNAMLTLLKDGQVRWLVAKKYKTSGAAIESITALMTTAYLLRDKSKAAKIFSATNKYYLSKGKTIDESFAVKAKDLKSLEFTCLDEQCKYKQMFDYVFFLDRTDSETNEEGKKLMDDYKKEMADKNANVKVMRN